MKRIIFSLALCAVAFTSCQKPDTDDSQGGTPDPECVVEYGGVQYHAILIGDNYWFTDNLRYVPEGYTVSSDYTMSTADKAQCIFYPAKQTGVANNKVTYENGSAANDSLNVKVGLLYNIYAYLLNDNLPEPSDTVGHKAYNGAQGICPDGWHIPTSAEWNTLVSYSTKSVIWGIEAKENKNAAFYEEYVYNTSDTTAHTSIVKANECGFNFCPMGTVTATATAPYGTAVSKSPTEFQNMFGLSYYASSTICGLGTATAPDIKPYGVMTTMSSTTTYSHGRLSLAQSDNSYGVSVRCVKPAR